MRLLDQVSGAGLSGRLGSGQAPRRAHQGCPHLLLALGQGGVDAHFRRLRHTLAQRQQQMRAALLRLFQDEVHISTPDGGYFLWLTFDARLDSRALYAQALTSGFSLAPGALFSSQGQHNHCLRLNSSHPWSPQLDAALTRLAGLIARQRETWQSPPDASYDKGP